MKADVTDTPLDGGMIELELADGRGICFVPASAIALIERIA